MRATSGKPRWGLGSFARNPRAALLRRLPWAGLFQALGLSLHRTHFQSRPVWKGVIKSEYKQRHRTAAWWNATSGRVSGRAVCSAAGRLVLSHAEACAESPLHHELSVAVLESLLITPGLQLRAGGWAQGDSARSPSASLRSPARAFKARLLCAFAPLQCYPMSSFHLEGISSDAERTEECAGLPGGKCPSARLSGYLHDLCVKTQGIHPRLRLRHSTPLRGDLPLSIVARCDSELAPPLHTL
jgi:hypothetical protein